MPKPLMKTEEGDWRSRSRKAAIPGTRVRKMRQALLAMDDSDLMRIARQTLGVKIKEDDAHLLVDRMLNLLEQKEPGYDRAL